jgi:hypothetical protein
MDEVCIANIGPRGRRQRALFGIVTLALGAAAVALLLVGGVARPFRLATFLVFFTGATGIFQARAKT